MFQARKGGIASTERAKTLRPVILNYLAKIWRNPDEGIWEVRGGPQHFVHSKVMAWVAFDRAAKERMTEAERWRAIAEQIRAEICELGFDPDLGSFVQAYGSKRLTRVCCCFPLSVSCL